MSVAGEGGGAQGVRYEEQGGGYSNRGVGGVMGRGLVAKMNGNIEFNAAQ